MKKLFLFFMIFAITKIYAQNYKISFAGSGACSTVKSVIVKNLTQCTDTILKGNDTLYLVVNSGIIEFNTDKKNILQIYPNPMDGSCTFDFEATTQGNTTISLYDITGKRIMQIQEFLSKGQHTYSLKGVNRGIYILKIESDNYSCVSKIVSTGSSNSYHGIRQMANEDNQYTNNSKIKSIVSEKSLVEMQYGAGNVLKIIGKSGNYQQTVSMLAPTHNQTVTFNFVDCKDADSNRYATIKIGTQIWMAENLKTNKYCNGDTIPIDTNSTKWASLSTGARCYYNNDSTTNANIYGALYNGYAATDIRKICPVGWHLSTDGEWKILEKYLDNTVDTVIEYGWSGTNIGTILKEACVINWSDLSIVGNNSSGFSALPGGARDDLGQYYFLGNYCNWWSSATVNNNAARCFFISYSTNQIDRYLYNKKSGLSIRCVKD